MFISNPIFFHPGSRIGKTRISIKVFLTQKTDTKLSKIKSGMFIMDSGSWPWFFSIPDPGSKKYRIPDPQHWIHLIGIRPICSIVEKKKLWTEPQVKPRSCELIAQIRDVYLGSRILIFTHSGSRIQKQQQKRGVKKNLFL